MLDMETRVRVAKIKLVLIPVFVFIGWWFGAFRG